MILKNNIIKKIIKKLIININKKRIKKYKNLIFLNLYTNFKTNSKL